MGFAGPGRPRLAGRFRAGPFRFKTPRPADQSGAPAGRKPGRHFRRNGCRAVSLIRQKSRTRGACPNVRPAERSPVGSSRPMECVEMNKKKEEADWSPGELDRLRKLYVEGASIGEMAVKLVRPWQEVMDQLRRMELLPGRPDR